MPPSQFLQQACQTKYVRVRMQVLEAEVGELEEDGYPLIDRMLSAVGKWGL